MVDPIATFEEFKVRKGGSDSDETRVTALLTDATALILAEVGTAGDEWDDESAPHEAKVICIEVAYRAWSNPDALAQSSMAGTALTYGRESIPDALFLTPLERTRLHKAAGGGAAVSVTLVTPYSGDDVDDWPELPL